MFKQRNQENGFAHVMIVVAAVILAAVGGVGYYVYSKNNADKDVSKSSSNSVAPAQVESSNAISDACNEALHDKVFCKFAGTWESLTNYTITITTTNNDGSSTMTLENESADKTRTTTSVDGTESAAYVVIGNDSYIKDQTDGSWTKHTSDASADSLPDVKDSLKVSDFDAEEVKKNQYKNVGKESCGKLTCFKYQVILSENPNSENFMWFDTKDYLLRRNLIKKDDTTTEVVISYDKVSISVPSPIK